MSTHKGRVVGISLIALAVAALITPSLSAYQQPSSGARQEVPCREERDVSTNMLHEMSWVGTRPVRNEIDNALVLFRLHRTKEASAALDAALSLLDVTRGRLMTLAERESVRNAVGKLRRCIETSKAAPLATLTLRTYEEDDRVADGLGAPAEPGAVIRFDALAVGRTAAGGVFKGRMPSGAVHVTAKIQPNEAGEAFIDLAPGGADTVSVVLQSSKEVTEETPLVVAEADGGILSAAATTFTLKFIAPAGRIRRIDEIDLLGPEGNIETELTPMFSIADGAMVAVDAAKVIGIMRASRAGPLVVSVQASDERQLLHASRVEFRIE